MEYRLANDISKPAAVGADEMAEMMVITRMEYFGPDFKIDLLHGVANGRAPWPSGYRPQDWSISDTDADGKITFQDLRADPLGNLPFPQFWMGEERCPRLEMSICFSEEADNRFMGVMLEATLVYTLYVYCGW